MRLAEHSLGSVLEGGPFVACPGHHEDTWMSLGERVNRSGEAYFTPAQLDGRWMVRVSIGAIPTEREHVAALWALLRRAAEDADR
jgi:hypothetical protein